MKLLLPLLSLFLYIFFFTQIVHAADVVINEYLPNPEGSSETTEWIELYNTTEDDIDLTDWKIDDVANAGSSIYSLSPISTISAKGFFILERSVSGIILNNDSDTIRLLNASNELIDEYTYSETEENIFYGRKIDGGTEWVKFSSSTKNSTNNTGSIIITPTNSPIPSYEPTDTSGPTKTPTLTKSPTFTPLPIFTKVPTKKITPAIKTSPTPKELSPAKKSEKKVLGDFSGKKPTESLEPTPTKVNGSSRLNPGTIFISIGGIFFIACGILIFYMKNKQTT